MKLHAMTVPDDLAQLSGWLEQQLLGPDLGALVAELTAVHGTAAGPGLEEVLGSSAPRLKETGLAGLPAEKLRLLLAHPQLLLDLQEWLLTAESPYWERAVAAAAPLEEQMERGRRLAMFHQAPTAPLRLHRPEDLPRGRAWYRQSWFASLATAAAVLLAFLGYQRFFPTPGVVPVETAWGWNKPGALRQDGPANAYLNRLADGAAEWFNEKPEQAAPLAKRIGELREGCSQLILAQHQPLSAADRLWLVDNCRRWGAQLDKQRDALEAGQDATQVREQTDATVRELVEALRKRARA